MEFEADVEARRKRFARSVAATVRRTGGITLSPAIVQAFASVPRDELITQVYRAGADGYQQQSSSDPGALLERLYADDAIVTRLDEEGRPCSSSSQPSLMALMLHWLDLAPGVRVLEVGAGTGYNAALLAEVVGDPSLITTIDIQQEVVDQTRRRLGRLGYGAVTVRCGDGTHGAADRAPFDRVIVTVGCPDISWHWVEQMVADGRLVVPLQHGGPHADPVLFLRRSGSKLVGRVVSPSGFMALQGNHSDAPWPQSIEDAQATTPDRQLPLFGDLDRGRGRWWDFAFFLALVDDRTYFSGVLALSDPDFGRVVMTPGGIRLWGEERLLDDLVTAHEQWGALGRPRLTDWTISMAPRSTDRPEHDPSDGVWLVTRADSWQTFSLGAASGEI